MPRPLPLATEPPLPTAAQGPLRTTITALLALLLAAGIYIRFGAQITALLATLAPTPPPAPLALVELPLIPTSQTQAAIAEMGLDATDAAALQDALKRGRLRLAHIPLLDDTPTLAGSHAVTISAGGYTRSLLLTRQPTVVTIPIGPVGEIAFTTSEADNIGIVGLTLSGPVRLPDLHLGQTIAVGVIAQ
jgi:hypothetical protein